MATFVAKNKRTYLSGLKGRKFNFRYCFPFCFVSLKDKLFRYYGNWICLANKKVSTTIWFSKARSCPLFYHSPIIIFILHIAIKRERPTAEAWKTSTHGLSWLFIQLNSPRHFLSRLSSFSHTTWHITYRPHSQAPQTCIERRTPTKRRVLAHLLSVFSSSFSPLLLTASTSLLHMLKTAFYFLKSSAKVGN